MRVIITELAERDIAGMYAYYAQRDPDSAGRVVGAVLGAANGLAQFPRLGRPGSVPGTRERVLTRYPYRIVYRIVGEMVEVLRVLHQVQQWP